MPIPAEPTLAPNHSPHGEQDSAVLSPEVDNQEDQASEASTEQVTPAPVVEPNPALSPVAAAPADVAPMVAAPPALAPMEGNPMSEEEPGMIGEQDAPTQEFSANEGNIPPAGNDSGDSPPADSGGAGGNGGTGEDSASGEAPVTEEAKEDEPSEGATKPEVETDAPAGPAHTTPRTPEEDPEFQATVARKDKTVAEQQAHEEPKVVAGAAQAASISPSNERESLAEAGQVNEMDQEEPGVFDATSFKAMLMEAIKAILPKNNDEADDFADSGKVDEVKNKATSQVESQKESAAGNIEQKTQEKPDTSSVPIRKVQPLAPQNPGPAPADIEASKAMPPKRGDAEVNAPLDQNVAEVDQKMADAEVTDEQLANSNEPAFTGALASKNDAKKHAKEAPVQFRQQEQETLAQSEANAQAAGEAQLTAMHQDRTGVMAQVSVGQQQTATKDTSARQKVADHINGLYEQTKTEVETILNDLDASVKTMFDSAAARATQAFEKHVEKRMSAYKSKRYSGLIGKARWLKDLFAGLPDEVNEFFTEGRNLYLDIMDGELTTIAEHVATELTAAKDRIQKGKQDIQDYVVSLPRNLQQVGKDAADAINNKFDELTASVNSKGEELVDTIADMYKESLDKVDARIEEMKAANRGLIDMALGALIGVIETILKIKKLLFELLLAALEVIGSIIMDPIGFLSNLIEGVKQGINNFINNILSNVMQGLIEWLTGSLGDVGIQMPENLFSLSGIFDLVTQMLGLTWDYFRDKAVKMLGEPVVEAMEKGFELFQIIRKDGVQGLWEYIKEQFTDLKEMVIDAIRDMIVTKVIEAGIKWILGLLSPAGAFIKAAMLIIDIVKFFVERAAQIFELVQAFIEGIKAVASGNVSAVAKAIEKALVKAIPILIGFLAALVGVTGLTSKIQKIIKKVRKRIDKAIRKIIKKAKRAFGKLMGKKKPKKGDAKKIKEDNKKGKPEKITAADKKKHKKIAKKIKKQLEKPAKKGESFEDFYHRKKKEAEALEDKYQPQLKKGINLDLKLKPLASDQKDDDVDIKLKIAPNDELEDISAMSVSVQVAEIAKRGKSKFGATGVIGASAWTGFVLSLLGNVNEKTARRRTKKMLENSPPLLFWNDGVADKSFYSFNPDEFSEKREPNYLELSKDYDHIKRRLGLKSKPPWPANVSQRSGANAVTKTQTDSYRQKVKNEIINTFRLSGDLHKLNKKVLQSDAIPNKLNRLRGDIFEKWLSFRGISRSAYDDNPTFSDKDHDISKSKRVADGYVGTELREAKVAKSKRSPGSSEIDQMEDYYSILSSGKALWQKNEDEAPINFTKIRYVFNDKDTADLWYTDSNSALKRILKGHVVPPLVGS